MNYDSRAMISNLVAKSSKTSWYEITNKANRSAQVRIYDEIGLFGTEASQFIEEIAGLDVDEIVVSINSKGGDVFDGISIFNALREHQAKVVARVDSMAASISSVIAQAGDERIMVGHSQMMIHEAQGFAIGDSQQMEKMAEILDQQSDIIAGIYAERAGDMRKKSKFRNLMKEETWFTDNKAVEEGLADRVEKPSSKNIIDPLVPPDPIDPLPSVDPDNDHVPQSSIDWTARFRDVMKPVTIEEIFS